MKTIIPAALILATVSAPGFAQEDKAGPERYAVPLARADFGSATPESARRALHRIDRAATAACGGAGGSLREVTKAVQASVCWRAAVRDAVRRIDAPLLTQCWQARRRSGART